VKVEQLNLYKLTDEEAEPYVVNTDAAKAEKMYKHFEDLYKRTKGKVREQCFGIMEKMMDFNVIVNAVCSDLLF